MMIIKYRNDIFKVHNLNDFDSLEHIGHFYGSDETFHLNYQDKGITRVFDEQTSEYFIQQLNEKWYIPQREKNINKLL